MQDSSTNPYIPQESQQVRAATETLSSPLKRIVKLLLIITSVLAVLIAIGLFFVVPRTSVEDKQARVEFANTIQPPGQLAKLVPVKSTLGFSLKYDNQMFVSYAETVPVVDAAGKEGASAYYENDELRTVRDYNMIRITPSESTDSDRAAVADPPQLVVASTLTADKLKTEEAKPDNKGLSQQALFVKLSSDQRLAAKTLDDESIVSIEATKPSTQTINGIKYQKVRFTTKNENNRIVNIKYDDCYYTIQNDTPYSACVTGVRPNSRDDAALNEKVLETLSFEKPAEEIVEESTNSSGETTTKETESTKKDSEEEQLALETPQPEYNTNFTSLSAIAKNQPSIVRVGTLYCADLNLKVASGEVITTLTDACVGNLASGTIISNDGLIATTGHAIRYDPKAAINGYINFADSQKELLDRLDRVLKYLLDARLILESDAEYLRNGAQIGDQEALAKIENIGSIIPDNYVTPTKDNYSYAVQPTDKPVVLDTTTGARPVFAYSDTVIQAKFVAAEYDTAKSAQENFDSPTPAKDVGILKSEGSFQNVSVGAGVNIKSDDILNTLSFPTFSDSSLVIGKNQNAPIVTNSKVNQTYDKDGQQLVQLNSPVTPGADGAGTFDQQGKLIGMSVYGLSYCPDQQCFANGTVRPSGELLSLIEEKNMKLGDLSEATAAWVSGVDDYFKGNYASAASAFAKSGDLYAFNRYAEPLQKLAVSKQGSASDTSLMNQLVGIMIGALVIMVILTLAFAVLFILQKRRLDSLRVGHYGAQPISTSPVSPVVPQQPVYPQQPMQQPYQQQQPEPTYVPPQQQSPQMQPQQPQQYSAPTQQQPDQQPYAPQPQTPQVPPQPQAQPPVQNDDPFYRQ